MGLGSAMMDQLPKFNGSHSQYADWELDFDNWVELFRVPEGDVGRMVLNAFAGGNAVVGDLRRHPTWTHLEHHYQWPTMREYLRTRFTFPTE